MHRGIAVVWDIGLPPPSNHPLPVATVDTVLAICTLSALPPEAPHAFDHLAACFAPGGSLLLRDYGRLDLKQIKFARTVNGRLGSSFEEEAFIQWRRPIVGTILQHQLW